VRIGRKDEGCDNGRSTWATKIEGVRKPDDQNGLILVVQLLTGSIHPAKSKKVQNSERGITWIVSQWGTPQNTGGRWGETHEE